MSRTIIIYEIIWKHTSSLYLPYILWILIKRCYPSTQTKLLLLICIVQIMYERQYPQNWLAS